jgi:hypothetical protein
VSFPGMFSTLGTFGTFGMLGILEAILNKFRVMILLLVSRLLTLSFVVGNVIWVVVLVGARRGQASGDRLLGVGGVHHHAALNAEGSTMAETYQALKGTARFPSLASISSSAV